MATSVSLLTDADQQREIARALDHVTRCSEFFNPEVPAREQLIVVAPGCTVIEREH
jgi:hypothetical protein